MSKAARGRLAGYINRVIKQKGLTRRQIQQRCGISSGYLSDLTTGRAENPSVDLIAVIAKGIDVEVEEVIEVILGRRLRTSVAPSVRELPDVLHALKLLERVVLNPDLLEIVQAGIGLSPKSLSMLAGFARDLKQNATRSGRKSRRTKETS
ncbi:MAG TPA: helix-turn-helix domain-containing protein [Blastocatellia bacterium]|nr:helix-turn-helix domain-containing protein [Blastocatellia bacterium]